MSESTWRSIIVFGFVMNSFAIIMLSLSILEMKAR